MWNGDIKKKYYGDGLVKKKKKKEICTFCKRKVIMKGLKTDDICTWRKWNGGIMLNS